VWPVVRIQYHENNLKYIVIHSPHLIDMANNDLTDYYSLLRITRSASPDTIKAAYHRALLHLHPDKFKQRANDDPVPLTDVGLLHDAFVTLSSSALRTAYDARGVSSRTGPRPAQVVSLDLFHCSEGSHGATSTWTLACRCGGNYEVTGNDLERGLHMVGCGDCSEVIWVGYEMAQEVDEGTTDQQEIK
jgi:diphthamide biosynthesis protein 4